MVKLSLMKFFLPAILLLFLSLPLFLQEDYLYPIYAKDATDTSRLEKRLEKIDTKRDKAIERLDTRKERFETRIETKKERIASRAAFLKEKLSKFKDKRKASIAERINDNLNKINDRRTEAMLRHLNKMSEILGKISSRLSQSTPSAQALTEAQTAISDAQAAINTAKEAVETQAEKDYTIEATTEARIRDDAKVARDSLHKDLKAVHDLVVAARKAVSDAISNSVSSLKGEGNGQ